MANLTRFTLFWRAFFVTLLFGGLPAAADPEEDAAWAEARAAGTVEALYLYLGRYPAGTYVEEALRALSELGATPPVPPRAAPRSLAPAAVY